MEIEEKLSPLQRFANKISDDPDDKEPPTISKSDALAFAQACVMATIWLIVVYIIFKQVFVKRDK